MGDEDRGRDDLIQAILRVLPIDPDDGTCVVHVPQNKPLPSGLRLPGDALVWGDPRDLARRILDALDEAYTHRDMQTEHMYERAVAWEEGGGF